MVKNGCDQSGLWTLKLILFQEWSDGVNWFFACWYNFSQIKNWLKIFWVSMVKNACGQSGDQTLKLTLSGEWTDGIHWFFACWYMITKIKSWSKNFLDGHFSKNGRGQSGHGTVKLTVSQKWTDRIKWFFDVGTNSGKLKVDSVIFGWAWSKMAMAFSFVRP